LQFDVLTIFPAIVRDAVRVGLLGKACTQGVVRVVSHDLRDYTTDKHRRVDDSPYGGGPGMVLQAEPVVRAIEAVSEPAKKSRCLLLTPRGSLLTQEKVESWAGLDQLLMVCGRYEGVDERVTQFVDEEISIGDYVLSGGEYAALVVIDAVARLIPGVVGDPQSLSCESHREGRLEYPQYTRPAEWRGLSVPEVLLTGDHEAIARWREAESEAATSERRPDLVAAPKKSGR